MPTLVGTKIYGYCNGYFGRDDYADKIIILEGSKWIVCAYLEEGVDLITSLNFESESEKYECVKKWSNIEEDC